MFFLDHGNTLNREKKKKWGKNWGSPWLVRSWTSHKMNLNPPRNKKTALKSPVFLNHNNPKAVLLKGKMGGSILDLAVPHRIHGWLVARCLVWAAALMEMKLPCPQGGWQGWEGELLHLLDISGPWMTTLIQMMSFPPSASLKYSESGRYNLKGIFFCCLSCWRKPTVRFISHPSS